MPIGDLSESLSQAMLVGTMLVGRLGVLHTRSQHLRTHRGFSVAFSNGCSVAVSNGSSLLSGIFQRIVTFPVDLYWNSPMDVHCHFPMEFHFCDFWCVIFVPEMFTRSFGSPGPRPVAGPYAETVGTAASSALCAAAASALSGWTSLQVHPVSITRFPLRRFSPGAGLLRYVFFIRSG